ncbi:OLC1v1011428C1 [Oldenlandia corymbosa var. corymbosa]|uniref:OLC1v1011428C1 n=1 Tax=Oldenlandia corymbosa var. corymbosa TaxID=529605 RepID=A0AAV1DWM6_OLDCO|nr:OLC1v1011428C1 [Oldenlandia corymbosa var. corymbosa]
MGKGDKRQKIHDALIRKLYPPPSPSGGEEEPESVSTSIHNLDFEHINNINVDFEGLTSSSDRDQSEDDGNEPKKLTRAQRKRLRQKKLKQAASQPRRKLIGPLLPFSTACEAEGDGIVKQHEAVRQNAAKGDESLVPDPEEEFKATSSGTKRNKLKQRRMAKKMTGDLTKLSGSEKSYQEAEYP